MSENSSEFISQLSGGTCANLVFVVAFMIYRVFSAKCKHSACKAKSGCFECSAQEDSRDDSKSDGGIHEEVKRLEEQLRSLANNLCQKRKTIVQITRRSEGIPAELRMVKEEGSASQV